MRNWVRTKGIGLAAFLAILALVVGGLGWVTLTALRLEEEQIDARNQTEVARRQADLHLALWRLDSLVFTEFARESSRPYQQFQAREPVQAKGQEQGGLFRSVAVVELALAPEVEVPLWNDGNYLVAPAADWGSNRVLCKTLLLNGCSASSSEPLQMSKEKQEIVAELAKEDTFRKLRDEVAEVQSQLVVIAQNPYSNFNGNTANPTNTNNSGTNANPNQAAPQAGQYSQNMDDPKNAKQRLNRDADWRFQQAATQQLQQENFAKDNSEQEKTRKTPAQIITMGPMVPRWLTSNGKERLIVTQMVRIGQKSAYQVTLLDWSKLQGVLKDEIEDLFPQARFQAVHDWPAGTKERTMAALPVALVTDTPALGSPASGWNPLRFGLILAWLAALIALLAVFLGGWSLIELSERRVHFVSAVTHELRTPLATLRLYLDMLTGGMVKDEQHKAEYLQTLHGETDRLCRLVGNVLDFSRLERQRPRLEMTSVPVAEVLEQVNGNWQGRCQSNQKELVVENQAGANFKLTTDVQIVQQILGNLIDNACKYSREAADNRIWLRAQLAGKQLILEVEDRGPGVPQGERRSIFHPFRRGASADVTAGGVGLGLALARRWAKLLGGKLAIGSGPEGKGACFRLELTAS